MQSVTDIYIYPIKSTKGIQLPQTLVEEKGLKDDRRYMVVDLEGKFITGRTHPQLTQVSIEFSKKGLSVSAPNQPTLYIQPTTVSTPMNVEIWEDNVQAEACDPACDQWFSTFLGENCRLVYFSETTSRCVKNKQTQVSFADGYPLLLINQTSVNTLNLRLDNPVSALHFRPNLLIKGEAPFIEDTWARIKIGEVEFEVSKPCSRCNFTNVDPKTGIPDSEQPLKTLAEFRFYDGNIDFGQNLIPLNEGVIRSNDTIQVLAYQTPRDYHAMFETSTSNIKPLQLHFAQSNKKVTGNDQALLLDQAEQAGIAIPYSCRGGKCGRCKTKLLSGEVNELTQQGLLQDEIAEGYILSCSSIPTTDISIDH